jgi:hypothetical protein
MRLIRRYLGRAILGSVLFVLAGFLALFAFFDLIGELDRDLVDDGRGDVALDELAGRFTDEEMVGGEGEIHGR